MKRFILLSLLSIGISANHVHAQADVKVWTRLAGTGGIDDGFAVAADPLGNCILAGETIGGLFGTYQGSRDLFVAKYDTGGNLLWGRQRGTAERDCAYGVTTDSSGNIYATGFTGAALDGQWYAGKWDIYLLKYSPSGDWLWTRQVGGANDDEGYAVTTDASGNVYMTGYIRGDIHGQTCAGKADVIICKYNSAGTRQWTRLFGSVEIDQAWAIACDASANVFVSGFTYGSIEGNPFLANGELFLAKYDTNGNRLWLKQWGTWNTEHGYDLATDASGNVYLSGYTTGPLYGPPNGGRDVFLAKFDASGNELWGRQFGCTPGLGTNEHDQGWGVAMGADGNVYLAGQVEGPFDGNPYLGSLDIFLAKYDPAGTRLWSQQLGTANSDSARGGVVTTADGITFLAGTTSGNLDGNTNRGSTDAFIMKFAPSAGVPPAAPTDGTPAADATDRITWKWTDVSSESGYRLKDMGGVNKSGDLAANTVQWQESGFAPNTSYTRRVYAFNALGESFPSAGQSRYTLSVPPAAASVTPDNTRLGVNDNVVWTAVGGFGPGAVQYYRYAWDQSGAHTWTGSEAPWSSGTITTTPTGAGLWYLHVLGYNGDGVANGMYDYPVTAAVLAPGDFDRDGDVDLNDFTVFQYCFGGPNQPPRAPNCNVADFDLDNDVDLNDFSFFQSCFNGPNQPPACE